MAGCANTHKAWATTSKASPMPPGGQRRAGRESVEGCVERLGHTTYWAARRQAVFLFLIFVIFILVLILIVVLIILVVEVVFIVIFVVFVILVFVILEVVLFLFLVVFLLAR